MRDDSAPHSVLLQNVSTDVGVDRTPHVHRVKGSRGRFLYIDSLRGLAAAAVMIFHFTGHRIFQNADDINVLGSFRTLFQYGYLGVPVFFVISGFVIAHSVAHARVNARYLGTFALRRSLRLDPPYWLAISGAVVGAFVSSAVLGLDNRELPTLGCVAAHVAYIYPWLGYEPIEPVFWTLVHEVQFYVVYIILLGLVQRISSVANPSPSLLLLFYGLPAILSAPGWFQVKGLCLDTWYMFALGVFAYWWYSGAVALWQCGCVAAGVVVSLWTDPTLYKLTALLTTASLYVAIRRRTLTSWLGWGSLLYLGNISYSLYLMHGIIGWRVLSIGERLTARAFPWAVVWLVFAIAASTMTAHFMREWVELPSIRLGKRLKTG